MQLDTILCTCPSPPFSLKDLAIVEILSDDEGHPPPPAALTQGTVDTIVRCFKAIQLFLGLDGK